MTFSLEEKDEKNRGRRKFYLRPYFFRQNRICRVLRRKSYTEWNNICLLNICNVFTANIFREIYMKKLYLMFTMAVLCLSFCTTVWASPIVWGPAGSDETTGVLDAGRVPNRANGDFRYTNVNNEGYDIVLSIYNQNANGPANFFGDNSWWFEGANYNDYGSTRLTFAFYQTGTNIPYSIQGIHFTLEDAERGERFADFAYLDGAGNSVYTLFNDTDIFNYSYTPNYFYGYTHVDSGAPLVSGTQTDKTIEVDLSDISISGFTFKAYRTSYSAGSVIMTDLMKADDSGSSTPEPLSLMLILTGITVLFTRKGRL